MLDSSCLLHTVAPDSCATFLGSSYLLRDDATDDYKSFFKSFTTLNTSTSFCAVCTQQPVVYLLLRDSNLDVLLTSRCL